MSTKNSITAIYHSKIYSLMKINSTTAILGVALAVVAGLFSASVSGILGTNSSDNTSTAGMPFTGHVETIVRDVDGNIKEYRQSDNVITNKGENCALRLLFQLNPTALGTGVCVGALSRPWDVIAVGSGGATAANNTQGALSTELAASGFTRAEATTKTWSNNTGVSGTAAASITMEKTFTNTGGSQAVSESGLFNSTTDDANDAMFARQTFTAITVNTNDSLTVRWTINVGGTGTFNPQTP